MLILIILMSQTRMKIPILKKDNYLKMMIVKVQVLMRMMMRIS